MFGWWSGGGVLVGKRWLVNEGFMVVLFVYWLDLGVVKFL